MENLNADGRIILKFIFNKFDGGFDWIDMVQNKDICRGSCDCGNEPQFP